MNWEAMSAIGELVGAIGVVATLVYVSVQVRHNTRSVQAATLNAITASHQTELRWSSDIAPAMTKATHRPEDLSDVETYQVTEWMTSAFLVRENEFSQHRQGLLDSDKWAQSATIVRVIAGIPWFRSWWSEYGRQIYLPDFVAWVDGVIAEGAFDTPGALKELEGARWRSP